MQLKEIAHITQGQLQGENLNVSEFSIDSRKINKNDCYVAIIGERLNGHDYILEAKKAGAISAIVSEAGNYPLPVVIVKDTVDALGALGQHHREHFSCPTMALTGSCGKTTVKEMLAAILPKPSFATIGNFNNHIGVPLSLLKLNESHLYAVFELGANHIGEIKRTVSWVKPDVAMITNVRPAHLDGFGSIDGVARAKAEIFEGLAKEGTALINIDDKRIKEKALRLNTKTLTFSLFDTSADIYVSELVSENTSGASFIVSVKGEPLDIEIQLPGRHNIMNALSAMAAAVALGIDKRDIQKGLYAFSGVSGRMTYKQGVRGALIIDDTYNANLASVKAAIDVLGAHQGKRILVLGELAEVDCERDAHYQAIAQYAKQHDIDLLVTCGALSDAYFRDFQNEQKHFKEKTQLIHAIKPLLQKTTTVLIKGSRSAKMEEVVEAFL